MKFLRIPSSDISWLRGRVIYIQRGVNAETGALENDGTAELKILLPRQAGVVSVFAVIHNESFTHQIRIPASLVSAGIIEDEYAVSLCGLEVGLYFFELQLYTAAGMLYGMKGQGRELLIGASDSGERFQLSICSFTYPVPEKYLGGVIYHVFVDRFCRGGKVTCREDAVLMDDWDGAIPEYPEYPGAHLENNTFFGGTLWGVIDKLDHIASLGTRLIYLSPVFEAYSNHKYDTGDYMKVDGMFGGDEALQALIEAAAERGIGIILDGVFNHTGADSVYFNKYKRYDSIGAYESINSPYYPWYDFQSHPDKYTSWWGIEILPRINPDVESCGDFIAGEGGVVEKYAAMGIAGMRLDVADELSDSFIARIKARLNVHDPDSLLYGEVWEDASNKIAYEKRKHYYLGSELDGVMNYPLRTGIIYYLMGKGTDQLRYALEEVAFNAPVRVRDMQMNLLGTHDTDRIITVLAGKDPCGLSNDELSVLKMTEEEYARGIALVRLAYTVLATVPGMPTVFYGDEVGLEGYHDPFNRRPYPWRSGCGELLAFYRLIGTIRSTYSVYRNGGYRLLLLNEQLLIFERFLDGEHLYTVINNSPSAIKLAASIDCRALVKGTVSKVISVDAFCSEIIYSKSKTSFRIR